jgi:hypothetical protein
MKEELDRDSAVLAVRDLVSVVLAVLALDLADLDALVLDGAVRDSAGDAQDSDSEVLASHF